MTVEELKSKLNQFPDELEVFMDDRKTEFTYGLLNGCFSKEIDFYEDPSDEEPLSRNKVVILSEE